MKLQPVTLSQIAETVRMTLRQTEFHTADGGGRDTDAFDISLTREQLVSLVAIADENKLLKPKQSTVDRADHVVAEISR